MGWIIDLELPYIYFKNDIRELSWIKKERRKFTLVFFLSTKNLEWNQKGEWIERYIDSFMEKEES